MYSTGGMYVVGRPLIDVKWPRISICHSHAGWGYA